VLGKQGEYVAAETELRRARSIQQELFAPDHPELAKTEEIYLLVQGKLNSIRTGRLPEGVQR
ncbi:MAG: tetratricopeptide repeat protein, partial [Planctomycetota bacterium]|nr:tetratricopeptide repeat protein [Planctomycetota bacterium]